MPCQITYICYRRFLNTKKGKPYALCLFCSIFIWFLLYLTFFGQEKFVPHEYRWLEMHQNISPFIQRPTSENYSMLCNEDTQVLIGIISTPPHRSERDAIRNSLGQLIPPSWKIIFFAGHHHSKKVQIQLNEESKIFKDIVMLDMEDNYYNLTIKVIQFFKWVTLQCTQPKYILKADDDIFINTKNMFQFINCIDSAMQTMYSTNIQESCEYWEPKKLIGHFIDAKTRKYESYLTAGFMYEGLKPDRNPKSKYFLSEKMYHEKILPNFLSGTSYLISSNLIPLILNNVNIIPLINLEDVYVTGLIMRQSMNLKLNHVEGWSNFRPQWDDPCLYKTLLTVHGLTSEEFIPISNSILTHKSCSLVENVFSHLNKLVSFYIPRLKKESLK